MHGAEQNQHETDFVAHQLNGSSGILHLSGGSKSQHDVTHIHQIEADHQQMVDRIGELMVAVERIDQKNAAIAV